MSFASFTVANLGAIVLAGPVVADDFNGFLGNIDLTSPMSFVDNKYKIVLSANNQFSLVNTIAYMLRAVQDGAMRNVNQGDLDTVMPIVAARVSSYSILAMVSATNTVITYRASDTVTAAAFQALALNVDITGHAQRIYSFIANDPRGLAEVGANAYLAPLALVVNHRHREEEKGHNWYTNEADVLGSTASKLLPMAGKRKEAFATYMRSHGHDLWHFLPDNLLGVIADGIVGEHELVVANAFVYKTIDINGSNISQVLEVGEACTDRYSGTLVGISSLILGVDYIMFFITQVSMKMPGVNVGILTAAVTTVRENLQRDDLDRDQLLNAKQSLHYAVAFTVGFCNAFAEISDDLRNHLSLVKFADSNIAGKSTGAAIGRGIRELAVDEEAMIVAVREIVNGLAFSLNNAANDTRGAAEDDE